MQWLSAMATLVVKIVEVIVIVGMMRGALRQVESTSWCVVRSNASENALQTALDYACGAGADCAPIQSSGLCFLPNTLQAHASYAFNSYYQRKSMAPGSCEFSGTANIAMTDPSYGSCVYPSSPINAGGTLVPVIPTPTTTITNSPPNTPMTPTSTTPTYGGGIGGLTPGLGPAIPSTDNNSEAASIFLYSLINVLHICILVGISLAFQFM